MAHKVTPKHSGTESRYSDMREEPVTRLLAPISGYEKEPLVSLEKSLERVSHLFEDFDSYVWVAKESCQQPEDGLTQDMSASIYLYTMQFSTEPSLYSVLNQTLRAESRQALKPWFPFLKLFFTALHTLPARSCNIWRGVRNEDLSSKYPPGKKFAWWGVSSCTMTVQVLESEQFLGKKGVRTLFSIECQNGRSAAMHSYFKDTEHEVILMPGSYFEVIGQLNPAKDLHIIQIKEINPPFPLVKPPFVKQPSGIFVIVYNVINLLL